MKEVIHIGFPKTATTTLQGQVFAKSLAIANIGRPLGEPEDSRLINGLALEDDGAYDAPAMTARVAQGRASGAQVLLYSDETVVNTPIRVIVAKRLHQLMPAAEIVAVVRNRFDALGSYYAGQGRHVRRAPEPYAGRHVSYENFLKFQFKNTRQGCLPTFDYATVLSYYAELFGTNRVHVLLYESFRADERAFIERLAGILDIAPEDLPRPSSAPAMNTRPVTGDVRYQALRTRMLRGVPISRLVPGAPVLKRALTKALGTGNVKTEPSAEWRTEIASYYREGNRRLADTYDLDLLQHGYPL